MKGSKKGSFGKSFLYAARGIRWCLRERNMRFHISAAVLVTAFSLVYHLTAEQYGLLFFVIGAVLALEAVNTAIERLADAVSEDYHPLIGAAKDLAAGAVLIMAIAAVFVGFALFFHFPRLTLTLAIIGTSWRFPLFLALLLLGFFFTFIYQPHDQ